MNRRIPQDAFAYYVSLGLTRSYQAVADRYGVSKTAVADLAERERWQPEVAEIDRKARDSAAKKAAETLEEMNDRHLKSLRVIQAKALEALRSTALDSAMDAVRALDLSIRQERVIRGEPGDRATLEIEDVVKREYARWMAAPDVATDAVPPAPIGGGDARVDPPIQ